MFMEVFTYAGKLESDINELKKEIDRARKINDYLYKAHKMKEDMIKRSLEENRILTAKNTRMERQTARISRSLGGHEQSYSKISPISDMRLGDAKVRISKGTVLMNMVNSEQRPKKSHLMKNDYT